MIQPYQEERTLLRKELKEMSKIEKFFKELYEEYK